MNNQKDIIQHFGVLGMHWGQHLRSAGEAHDARTLARDQARKTKISNAVSNFNAAGKAHDARTLARDKTRQERVRKIGLGFDKGSYNGRVFYEDMIDDFKRVGAAQLGGQLVTKMGFKTAGTILKNFGTTYVLAGTAASLILRTTKTDSDGTRKNIASSRYYTKDK